MCYDNGTRSNFYIGIILPQVCIFCQHQKGVIFMTNLKTIDGETLVREPLQPLNFVVDTPVSQGLHILAGAPKVGKSWLHCSWR